MLSRNKFIRFMYVQINPTTIKSPFLRNVCKILNRCVRNSLNFYTGKSEHARVKTHEEDIVVIQCLSVICYGILTVTRTLEQSFDFRG